MLRQSTSHGFENFKNYIFLTKIISLNIIFWLFFKSYYTRSYYLSHLFYTTQFSILTYITIEKINLYSSSSCVMDFVNFKYYYNIWCISSKLNITTKSNIKTKYIWSFNINLKNAGNWLNMTTKRRLKSIPSDALTTKC